VLGNEFAEGDAIRVDVVNDRLSFERLTQAASEVPSMSEVEQAA
jgi:hypothetical protein